MATDPPKDSTDALATHPRKESFGRTYWMCNSIEMFERLAYFGIRAVVPIYIMQATEPGGLHLTAAHKGWIYAWWAVFQSFLPMFTGGYADRYGYKRVLFFAINANVVGYVMMAYMHTYYGFFAGILLLATGTAFFKPALQGSIAQSLTKANSSFGWGIFYWVVNIGAFGAPFLATIILGKPHSAEGWRNLFLASAVCTCLNLLLLLTFKDAPSGASKTEDPLQVLWRTLRNIFEPRLITWLLIMSCFWLMMYQLWDLHPNFIEDWIDSSMVAAHMPFDAWREYGDRGIIRVPQQILLSLNAGLIILLILPLSWLVRRMRTLSCMLIGMSVATTGVLVAGLTDTGWVLLLGVVFFSLGEMLTGPKKNEYLGLIAPKGKKGLYLGYVNIPVGIGVGIGSWVAGYVYGEFGEKASLALDHLAANNQLVARAAQAADWSDSLESIPLLLDIKRGEAFDLACKEAEMGPDQTADMLRKAFKYDQGQVVNLALQHLALRPEMRDKTITGLSKVLTGRADDLADTTRTYREKVEAVIAQAREDQAKPPDQVRLTGAGQIILQAGDIEDLVRMVDQLARGQADLKTIPLARFVDLLPDALGKKRVAVLEIVRERMAQEREGKGQLAYDDAIEALWAQFGHDPENLNNLALEYLAQGTDRVRDAVAAMTFHSASDDLKGRRKEIEQRLGIGRTKSFAALSAAMGADEAGTEQALHEIHLATGSPEDRAFVYLAGQRHRRFIAIARRDWTKDVKLLQDMIDSDSDVMAVVLEEIDEAPWYARLFAWAGRLFTGDDGEEETLARRLADKQELIHKALKKKDWSRTPDQAARLLGLSPFEVRALVAAEANAAPVAATRLLWETYHPQYKVWIPFASIGVLAAIALGIFGQMAKRWKDMNA